MGQSNVVEEMKVVEEEAFLVGYQGRMKRQWMQNKKEDWRLFGPLILVWGKMEEKRDMEK